MKRILGTIVLLFSLALFMNAQTYKPYTLAGKSGENLPAIKTTLTTALEANGLKILGSYQPANDPNRWLIVITSNDLINAVKQTGGLTGFGSALRVAITKEKSEILISYTTPEYWGNAYFQKQFPSVQNHFKKFSGQLKSALKSLGLTQFQAFGSKSGMSTKQLHRYHYMMGMPYFEDNVVLKKFDSYNAAIKKIDGNLSAGIKNLRKVYSIDFPGKQLKLYGIALSGGKGESTFLPTIDINNPKHTAFLPYEILVWKNKAYMLHGRYRIALSFPDLSMGTFMKIVSTPGNIEDLMQSACQ